MWPHDEAPFDQVPLTTLFDKPMTDPALCSQIDLYLTGNTQTQPDDLFMSIVDVLFSDESLTDELTLTRIVDALSALARETWWRCPCGPVRPTDDSVDAFCPTCGELRHLPARLSFPIWTAYVTAIRRIYPQNWFERLTRWCQKTGLLAPTDASNAVNEPQVMANSADVCLTCLDGMRIHPDGRVSATNWIALPLPSSDELARL